jgi:hypothetical protein
MNSIWSIGLRRFGATLSRGVGVNMALTRAG